MTASPGGSAAGVRGQHWDPNRYVRNAGFVADLGGPALELLAPCAGERILDLGCGDGRLTRRLADLGVEVVGIDSSTEQIAAARATGLDARVADGEALRFSDEFDAVFSNAALHWMRRPAAVIDGVWRALRHGGRFVGEMGGHGNVARITAALVSALDRRGLDGAAAVPWYFPTPEAYGALLRAQGFRVSSIALIPRPTPLPGEIAGWLETFAESFVRRIAPEDRADFIAEVAESLRPILSDGSGNWTADYVRLRFAAWKPAPESGPGRAGLRDA
ncbi:class I SAM-dependent methyltransferase [Rhodospirillaceae bacterium SYSU D60014]|uniref:methyltransferase domain-containing protein n=1 Tax=Virgifigura deserti TaxID=2268457 RepID=UPI000E6735E8